MQSLVVVALVYLTGPAQQQPAPASFELAAVQASGAKRYTADDVTRLSGLVIGQPMAMTDLQAAADRLISSGLFKELRYRYVTAGKHLTVVFEFEEAAWTVPVVFDNIFWIGAIYDDFLASSFYAKEISPRRPPGGKAPVMEMEANRGAGVINLRFVFE